MSYLFLSYSKRDKKFAQNVSLLLQKAGFAVWMDENPRELTAHEWPIIEENIRNAAAFVLLVSESAKQSAWVKRELDFAESIEKPIFPILIEGQGWSRLKMPLETLELGIHLSLPDSLWLKLKALDSPLPVELPPQIPSYTIDYKRGKAKQSFLLWLGIMATMILAVVITAPLIVGTLNYGKSVAASQDALNAAASETVFYNSVLATRQSSYVQATQAREDFIQQRTQERATNLAVREESRLTRTQEQLQEEANATAIQQTRAANASQALIMQNTQVLASATQQANYNLTAIAGNGNLPCKAFVYLVGGTSNILLYRRPNLSLNPFLITRREAQEFIVVEWLANEDGYWYRIGTETQYAVGYARPESLVLDDACPR